MDVRPQVERRNGDSILAPVGRRVQRSRVVTRIERSDCPLLLVVAPSGFGKTSLLTQWAAALLSTARQGAQINGRPLVETIVESWIARLAIARQDRAGALAAVAQAGLVLGGPSDSVRAQLAVGEFRVCVELAPERADAIVPELPDDPTSRLLRARLALRRRDPTTARRILDHVGPVSIRDHVEWGVLSSLAYRRHDARQAHTYLAAPWTSPNPTGTPPPSSDPDMVSRTCCARCLPRPGCTDTSRPGCMSLTVLHNQLRPRIGRITTSSPAAKGMSCLSCRVD